MFFFFFNDTATTEIYTLSLHDALPICLGESAGRAIHAGRPRRPARSRSFAAVEEGGSVCGLDRKSTRLNSSHGYISYAVFCLKKKNTPVRKRSASCFEMSVFTSRSPIT